jgi:hypothetical protein
MDEYCRVLFGIESDGSIRRFDMGDTPSLTRRSFLAGMAMTTIGSTSVLMAQSKTAFNERTIEPQVVPDDREGVYTLNFTFTNPRVIVTDVPGRGRKVVWYMLYRVYNLTNEPRQFVPEIEFVTLDPPTVHTDEVLPSVQKAIDTFENVTTRPELALKNSVTIQKDLIPVSKKDAFPRAVPGVAIWTSIHEKARDMNKFSVFIAGLSDGYTNNGGTIRRKSLQLNFERTSGIRKADTDDAADVKFRDFAWVYRATSRAETPKKK